MGASDGWLASELRQLRPYLIYFVAVFYGLGLATYLAQIYVGYPANYWFDAFMVHFPLLTLGVGTVFGIRQRPSWLLYAAFAIIFSPSTLIFTNYTALGYLPIYLGLLLLGNGIGWVLRAVGSRFQRRTV